jgi:hypothetical protein
MTPPTKAPRYSFLDQLRDKLESASKERIRTLSGNDLKAVMLWLELKQFDIATMISVEDDALESAKSRGKVELIVDLCGELLGLLGEVGGAIKEERDDG